MPVSPVPNKTTVPDWGVTIGGLQSSSCFGSQVGGTIALALWRTSKTSEQPPQLN